VVQKTGCSRLYLSWLKCETLSLSTWFLLAPLQLRVASDLALLKGFLAPLRHRHSASATQRNPMVPQRSSPGHMRMNLVW
jgi:hypothetical protein